jgi:phosphatidylserine/phosphatidylglycerophosphate/cardiolipin synthase-like enzyme
VARLPTRDHRRDDPRRPSLPHRDAVLALMASSLIAAACGSPTSSGPRSPAATSRAAIPHAATSAPGATATMGPATAHPGGALSLITEPEDGYHSIDQLISGARRIIDLTMYELADDQIQSLLVAARQRGVSIRVLFDHAHDGASVDQAAYSQLGCAGVPVRLAPDAVIFHQRP